jgi:hypothetical protein
MEVATASESSYMDSEMLMILHFSEFSSVTYGHKTLPAVSATLTQQALTVPAVMMAANSAQAATSISV